jgi:acyl-CoA thioesterase FadM
MGLALQFEAEATYADPIRATAQIDEDADSLRVQHRLAHAEDDRTLAIATTTWGAEVEKSSG